MPEEKLAVVIPAKNEEHTVGTVIERVEEEVDKHFDEVVFVVSSGSSDSTNDISRDKGAIVIRDGGRGLGEAMLRGLKRAVKEDADFILTIDSDLQFQPDEAGRLIEKKEDADLVLGSRFLEDGVEYSMSVSHKLGNRILTGLVNSFTGLKITDAQTGYRLMNSEVAEELRMVGRHTYVQETVIDAYHNGFEITEVPVTFAEREEGGSKVVSSISEYALRTLPVILHRSKFTAYMLNGLSLVLLVFTPLILVLSVYFRDITLAVLGFMALLLSIQAFFTGMFIDGELP